MTYINFAQEAGKQTLMATAEVSQRSEGDLTGQRKAFLKRNCGLLSCQATVAGRRYIPKGGFINVFEEITDKPPKKNAGRREPSKDLKSIADRYRFLRPLSKISCPTRKSCTCSWQDG